jgi:hypothetical protein
MFCPEPCVWSPQSGQGRAVHPLFTASFAEELRRCAQSSRLMTVIASCCVEPSLKRARLGPVLSTHHGGLEVPVFLCFSGFKLRLEWTPKLVYEFRDLTCS